VNVLLAVPALVAPAKVAPTGRPVAVKAISSPSTGSEAETSNVSTLFVTTDLLPMAAKTGGTSTAARVVAFVVSEYGLLDVE